MDDAQNNSDDLDMTALRAQAFAVMQKFNAAHPDHGAQVFLRQGDGVHLINPDGSVDKDSAEYDPKENVYRKKKILKI